VFAYIQNKGKSGKRNALDTFLERQVAVILYRLFAL